MRVLELNDAGLSLRDGQQLLAESPGYAALDGKRLLVGEDARARLRIDPRRCNDRFWYQLDASLPAPMAEARSAADLAHAHLQSFGAALTAEPLLIAAPGSFSAAQLGVLLGLLQALGARAQGLFDPAAAAASGVETEAQVVHVDVQLHRFVFTVLGGEQALDRVRVVESKPGLSVVRDRCAAVLAQSFVRQTRFDPLHSARTEQLLYDQLPAWLNTLAHTPTAVLEIEAGGRTHRATVDAADLAEAIGEPLRDLADTLRPLRQVAASTVLLSARAATVPGLAAALAPATVLDASAAARGALTHAARIASDTPELPWVTRLPRTAAPRGVAATVASATHVLVGASARPLPRERPLPLSSWLPGAPGVVLRHEGEWRLDGAQGGQVRINGEPARADHTLRLGDRIVSAGAEVRLIEVVTST